MNTDWYTLARRTSLAAFVLLTVWGVAQASGQLALDGGIPSFFNWEQTINQWGNICLWPLLGAPIWYRIVYLLLGFWLILPYLVIVEVR